MRRTTDRTRRACVHAAVAVLLLSVVTGCKRRSAPFDPFEIRFDPAEPPGKKPPEPPQAAFRPWRVWINQERPRQKKNPQWQTYGAKDGVTLDLAADGHWSCLLNPVALLASIGERGVVTWTARRTIRCSPDHFSNYVETQVRAGFDAAGNATGVDPNGVLHLNETVSGAVRSTVVVLEGEKTTRRPAVD